MTTRLSVFSIALVVMGLVFVSAVLPGSGQARQAPTATFPRTTDGRPDLNGIWQANNAANWDIQDHSARMGPVVVLGAAFSVPAGLGVVVGNDIPYKPEALAKKKEFAAKWVDLDPEAKCYMPGIPRATYMPYPFQIVQTPQRTLMVYEFAGAARMIYMTKTDDAPVDAWMGLSRGRWEGDTLVIDVTGLNGEAWFDRAGNFQSNTLHVIERYTPMTRDALQYEVTIEDPTLYTRPWKMTMPLYRRLETNVQLLEYKCVEFAEEKLYGHLKPAAK
jgi:hypothetical protein